MLLVLTDSRPWGGVRCACPSKAVPILLCWARQPDAVGSGVPARRRRKAGHRPSCGETELKCSCHAVAQGARASSGERAAADNTRVHAPEDRCPLRNDERQPEQDPDSVMLLHPTGQMQVLHTSGVGAAEVSTACVCGQRLLAVFHACTWRPQPSTGVFQFPDVLQ